MKKQLISLIINLLAFDVFAQSTTILPNSVGVPVVSILATCDANNIGKQIYNSSDNKMYFCNGTAWTDMTVGGFTLPYSGSGSVVAPNILFNVSNSSNGRAITGETTSPTYGIGVYGSSTNTAPSSASPSTVGVFGINNSQNANGIGVYGQHDGTGKAIYGVVKNSGIGVYGLGLSVSSGGNSNGIGVKGESTGNYGVFGLSNYGLGVRGESNSSIGVYGTSNTNIGVYGYSQSYYAGYFENTSASSSTIYAFNWGGGRAAYLDGNVRVGNNLEVDATATINSTTNVNGTLNANGNLAVDGSATVNNGKGVVYNQNSSTNLKISQFVTPQPAPFVLTAHSSFEFDIDLPSGFTNTPTVLVGSQYSSGGVSGELYRVILVVYNCTTTSCKGKAINTDNSAINYWVRWNLIAIGN